MKMNYFRIKMQTLLLAGTALLLLHSCQEKMELSSIERSYGSGDEIQFQNFVSGMTRASRNTGETFVSGDSIGVYGFQTSYLDDGTTVDLVSKIFNNQMVTSTGAHIWQYSPVKYWEKSSKYDFYAIYPFSKTSGPLDYTLASTPTGNLFTINGFSVEDNKDNQIDIMIAMQKKNQPSYHVVNFEFNHVLSNVSFKFKTADSFNPTGISQVEVLSFKVTNLYRKGTFSQTGWDANNVFIGAWAPDPTAAQYDLPVVSGVVFTPTQPIAPATTTEQTAVDLSTDLLLLPQTFDASAQIEIKYKVTYDDGAEAVYRRKVDMNKIQGHLRGTTDPDADIAEWKPNYRYFYTIAADPSLNEHGGKYQAIANADNDRDEYPTTTIAPTVNVIRIYLDSDNITDAYSIDEDLDGNPDYPIIWQDLDNDGVLWGLVDRNSNGTAADDDTDGKPNVIYLDLNPRNNIVDTPLQMLAPAVPPTPTPNPADPTAAFVDYNGNGDADGYTTPVAWLIHTSNGYFIDTNNDGVEDITVLWMDIDGDGILEGVADKDGNGSLTPADAYDDDAVDYNGNPSTYDVIRYLDYSTGSPVWKDLERYEIPEEQLPKIPNTIEFSAEVEEWKGIYDAPVTFE